MRKTVIIILLIAVPLVVFAPNSPDRSDPDNYLEEYFMNYAPLTRETLERALDYAGIVATDVVLAQSRLETGNFSSVLCLQYNNLFGMKMPRVRNTTASGMNENGFAVYDTWYHSVLDMKEFQEYYRSAGRCMEDYFSFLSGIGYAEDPFYIQKLAQLCSI